MLRQADWENARETLRTAFPKDVRERMEGYPDRGDPWGAILDMVILSLGLGGLDIHDGVRKVQFWYAKNRPGREVRRGIEVCEGTITAGDPKHGFTVIVVPEELENGGRDEGARRADAAGSMEP